MTQACAGVVDARQTASDSESQKCGRLGLVFYLPHSLGWPLTRGSTWPRAGSFPSASATSSAAMGTCLEG